MHFHIEMIIPPVDETLIEETIDQIMHPFDENNPDSYHAFWDWYVIGGRWAGEHIRASVDPEKLLKFHEDLQDRKITVSGVVCGKQTLQPESQIPIVDGLWKQYFPESGLDTCPLFSHFKSQYDHSLSDVQRVKDIHPNLSTSRVIIGSLTYDDTGYEAKEMFCTEIWNGCTHQNTTFDGNVRGAIELYHSKNDQWTDKYKAKHSVKDDWLCITLDYHS